MKSLSFLILTLLLLLDLLACSKKAALQDGGDVDYYTCTMHPSVHSKDPGKCPICSMDLVPVMKTDALGSPVADTCTRRLKCLGASPAAATAETE